MKRSTVTKLRREFDSQFAVGSLAVLCVTLPIDPGTEVELHWAATFVVLLSWQGPCTLKQADSVLFGSWQVPKVHITYLESGKKNKKRN